MYADFKSDFLDKCSVSPGVFAESYINFGNHDTKQITFLFLLNKVRKKKITFNCSAVVNLPSIDFL